MTKSQQKPGLTELPNVADQIAAILRSSSYRLAEQDTEFLASEGLRGMRLQLEYEKAEQQLQAHAIEHTIVVFGSARVPEPAVARERIRVLEDELSLVTPQTASQRRHLQEQLRIAKRHLELSRYYDVARDFAQRVSRDAIAATTAPTPNLVIMTGGGPGLMEAANRGAFDVGAPSVGLNISLPREQIPNPYVSPLLCLRFHYFALRKLHFLHRAKAMVAFPGGFGTFDELFETLTLIQTKKIAPVPIVLVGKHFWENAVNIDFMLKQGVISAEDHQLFWYAETAEEIWSGILDWHQKRGKPLLP